jgi:hypothetical protein
MFDKSDVFTLSEAQAKAAKAASQSDDNAVRFTHPDEVSP